MKNSRLFFALIILLAGSFLLIKAPFFINIIIVVSVYIAIIFWEFLVFQRSFHADFKMRSQKKEIDIFDILLSIYWTFIILGLNDYEKQYRDFLLVLLVWSLPIISLLLYFVYKKKKPFTVFINDDELILNNRWVQRRNLKFLIRINESTFTNELKLNFKGKSEVSFFIKDYQSEDIQEFLRIITAKTEQPLEISPYIKKTYQNLFEKDEKQHSEAGKKIKL